MAVTLTNHWLEDARRMLKLTLTSYARRFVKGLPVNLRMTEHTEFAQVLWMVPR